MEAQPSTSALSVAAPFTTPPCLFTVVPLGELAAGSRTSVEGDAIRFSAAASAHVQAVSPLRLRAASSVTYARADAHARAPGSPSPMSPAAANPRSVHVRSRLLPAITLELRSPPQPTQGQATLPLVSLRFHPQTSIRLLRWLWAWVQSVSPEGLCVCVCGCYCLVHKLYSAILWPPTLDCSPPGSSVHGILQARILVGCHSLLQRILLTQGSNQSLPHCRQTLYYLSHQESLKNVQTTL